MNLKIGFGIFNSWRACAHLLLFVLAFSLNAPHSVAGIFTISDDNSSADFDTTNPGNNSSWVVDGTDHLFQQAFWYRLGNNPEVSLHSLPIVVEGVTDTNFDFNPDTLFVRYNGGAFLADVRYVLDGGAAGSFVSDIAEQITITNTGAIPLDLHFFQYVDFDLNGSVGGDSAVFTNANAVQQSEGSAVLTETVITPVPAHREINDFPATVNSLNDLFPTTLNDAPAIGTALGPGDMTWAFQWDTVIGPNQSFQISKDKHLVGVPEPASALLLTIAAISAVMKRKIA